ncbi:MAG: hypothetical protein DME95_03775, partial [Verrucomicrobia bacterium]
NLLAGRSDVVQGDDDKIPRGPGRCDQWKELGCRNCGHLGIFGSGAALNKAKGGTRCPQRVGQTNRGFAA